MESGIMIRNMVMEFIVGQKVIDIMVNGKMALEKVMVYTLGLQVIVMLVK